MNTSLVTNNNVLWLGLTPKESDEVNQPTIYQLLLDLKGLKAQVRHLSTRVEELEFLNTMNQNSVAGFHAYRPYSQRVDEEAYCPTSLPPPPRPRQISRAPSLSTLSAGTGYVPQQREPAGNTENNAPPLVGEDDNPRNGC